MRGFCGIGLYHPENAVNVGSVMRLAGNFGSNLLVVSGGKFNYKNLITDTGKAWRHMPYYEVDDLFDAMPANCVPIAVEIVEDSIPLPRFSHPESGFYIFGPEGSSLGKKVIEKCVSVVTIPCNHCLNLSHAVAAVLYDREVKLRWQKKY